MSGSAASILTVVLLAGSGVVAGVFYAFSTFIMPALARLPDDEGARAMQTINVTVLTPLFLGPFMATGIAGTVVIVLSVLDWQGTASAWRMAASLLYLLGVLGVTIVFNVPWNEHLAGLDALRAETATEWHRYLAEWTRWNTVRTVAGIAAMLACAAAVAAD